MTDFEAPNLWKGRSGEDWVCYFMGIRFKTRQVNSSSMSPKTLLTVLRFTSHLSWLRPTVCTPTPLTCGQWPSVTRTPTTARTTSRTSLPRRPSCTPITSSPISSTTSPWFGWRGRSSGRSTPSPSACQTRTAGHPEVMKRVTLTHLPQKQVAEGSNPGNCNIDLVPSEQATVTNSRILVG